MLKVELYLIMKQDSSGEARHVRMNLEETHMKMRENMRSKLDKYLELLLEMPSEHRYHWWFDLILYPRYVNELTNFKNCMK